jgi:plastocyanin
MRRMMTVMLVAAALSLPLAARQASPAGSSVTIENFVFTPARLVVHKGDAVTFVNNDIVRHDVTGKGWSAGTVLVGSSGVATLNEAGTFDYICTRHPGMQGTIVVE